MKFGTGYAYWRNEWECDYISLTKKVSLIGFDILEIGADHLAAMDSSYILRLKETGQKYGIEFTTNCGPSKQNDLASPDPLIREHGITYFDQLLHNMSILGSKLLVGALYSHWPTDFFSPTLDLNKKNAWDRSINCLKQVGAIAASLNIECSLEVLNRNETFILTNCDEALEYIEEIGLKNVNVLLDTYHMNIEEDNMFHAIRKTGEKLGHFHVGECNRKLPGMNNSINWFEIGRALRDINYQKAVVMEPFLLQGGSVGRDMRVWRPMCQNTAPEELDRYITDSLVFLKQCLLI